MELDPKNPYKEVLSIAFSGGFDSTGLLIKALTETNYYLDLHTFCFNGEGVVPEEELDIKASKLIPELLKIEYPERFWNYTLHEFKIVVRSGKGGGYAMFLAATLPWVVVSDKVWLGHIRYDDIWHYKENFLSVFNGSSKIANREKLEIEFPLEWETKPQIYYNYYQNSLKVHLHDRLLKLVHLESDKINRKEYDFIISDKDLLVTGSV